MWIKFHLLIWLFFLPQKSDLLKGSTHNKLKQREEGTEGRLRDYEDSRWTLHSEILIKPFKRRQLQHRLMKVGQSGQSWHATNSRAKQRGAPSGDVSKWCMAERKRPNMKVGGFSSSLRDQNQTVQESCQEALPGSVNWVSNDQLAKRGKPICKVEERLCEDRFPFTGWEMRWTRRPNINVGEACI